MIEVLETIEIEGEECDLAATFKDGMGLALYRRMILPGAAKDDFQFCGHTRCWNELAMKFEMSLN